MVVKSISTSPGVATTQIRTKDGHDQRVTTASRKTLSPSSRRQSSRCSTGVSPVWDLSKAKPPARRGVRFERISHSLRQLALGLGAPVGRPQPPKLDNIASNPATPAAPRPWSPCRPAKLTRCAMATVLCGHAFERREFRLREKGVVTTIEHGDAEPSPWHPIDHRMSPCHPAPPRHTIGVKWRLAPATFARTGAPVGRPQPPKIENIASNPATPM